MEKRSVPVRYKPPERKHPLAAVHPRAFRACVWCNRVGRLCAFGTLLGLAVLAAVVFVFRPTLMFYWPLWFLLGSVSGQVLAFVVRWVIIAFFFTRYSLAQLLSVVLCFGACGTGIAALPDEWKLIPALVLACLVIAVFFFVMVQAPDGPVYTPAFLRRALARKRRQAENGNTESGR